MQRQRGELVPIGEVVADLNGPVQAIRDTSPQALHHFTQADQVNQLVSASEAAADLGFMGRTMALCSLPRTNPGNRLQYKRVNGPFKLIMTATGDHKLPFGNFPRLILAWVCTEAVRTQSRDLVLGRSLSKFMRSLGIKSDSGGARGEQTRLRNQMKRLFGCTVSLIYQDECGETAVNSVVARRTEFWWNERKPDELSLWESKIELGEDLFNEIISHPVPLNMNTLTALKRSPLGLDLYLWAVYRTFPLRAPLRLTWRQLYQQFGSDPDRARDKRTVLNFRMGLSPRTEEDQAGLAGVELLDGSGRPDPVPLNPNHRAAQSRPVNKLGSPFPGLSAAPQRPLRSGLDSPVCLEPRKGHKAANRLFPQACVILGSYPR